MKAFDIQNQLSDICSRETAKLGLGWNKLARFPKKQQDFELEEFLKCIAAGLFLQSASRCAALDEPNRKKTTFINKYKTKVTRKEISIHPTSSMFGRSTPPKCVVYTELLVTKKNYIRGVTQIC